MALDFNGISTALNKAVTTAQNELDTLKDANLHDPTEMLKFQQKVNEWTIATNLQSTTIKALKDALQGVVQKM
ncbi:type III secretion system needle filament subunit SctF [Pseudomonas sp. HK3]|jgi:type III secretion protein F